MNTSTLNIAVLLDSADIFAWQKCVLDDLGSLPAANIRIVVVDAQSGTDSAGGAGSRSFRRFEQNDRARSRIDEDALAGTTLQQWIDQDSRDQRGADIRCDTAVEVNSLPDLLVGSRFDILLVLGAPVAVDELPSVPGLRTWLYWHDYGQSCLTAGFREVLTNRGCLRSSLVEFSEDNERSRILYESHSAVHLESFAQTRNQHLWKIAQFVNRSLRQRERTGEARQGPSRAQIAEASRKESLAGIALRARLATYFLRRVWRKVMRRCFEERWTLLLTSKAGNIELDDAADLEPPAGRFWADPFLARGENGLTIFFEDAATDSGFGRIAAMPVDGAEHFARPVTVLEKPYHLSYPFVFDWQGSTYMIPESGANRTVSLYRCIRFPDHWEFVRDMMEDIDAFDATLLDHDGRWWMFVNVRPHPGASDWDELCVYYSDSPTGTDWVAHPGNPVVSDVRRARPAGHLYRENGRLLRPSQDSSFRYGYALNINEVEELTTETYAETCLQRLPSRRHRSYPAMHTINTMDDYVVVDAIRRRARNPFAPLG